MRWLSILLTLILFAGCGLVGKPLTPEESAAYEARRSAELAAELEKEKKLDAEAQNTPRCYNTDDCARMWAAARAWVSRSISWKIQTMSEGFLETYNPTEHSPKSAARVVQEPIPNGGYQYNLSVWCRNMFGCNPDDRSARISFNKYVWDSLSMGKMGQSTQAAK